MSHLEEPCAGPRSADHDAPATGTSLGLTADEVLTTTRAVRKRLDLTGPVPPELVDECVRITVQAPDPVLTAAHCVTGQPCRQFRGVPRRRRALDARETGSPDPRLVLPPGVPHRLSVHQAMLFRQWTDRLTLLLHTAPELDEPEAERLAARDVTVVHGEVAGMVAGARLTGVRLATGDLIPLDALAVAPRSVPRSSVVSVLGLEPRPHLSGMGEHIAADGTGMTSVQGVWVEAGGSMSSR